MSTGKRSTLIPKNEVRYTGKRGTQLPENEVRYTGIRGTFYRKMRYAKQCLT